MKVVQTHGEEFGQIYIPFINWTLMIATIGLVLGFRSSGNLASAYGVAISTDMVITTILAFTIAKRWGWNPALLWITGAAFLVVDLAFFSANLTKIWEGGWYPLLVGGAVFTVMATWHKGRILLAGRLREEQVPIGAFLSKLEHDKIRRTPGTAIFMTSNLDTIPAMLRHHVDHNQALHEKVILFQVEISEVPRVPAADRLVITEHGPRFHSVLTRYGFMQTPNVPVALRLCDKQGFEIDLEKATFYLGRETLIPSDAYPGMMLWRDGLFAFMSRNAARATQYYHIPPEQVVELGLQVEI